MLFRSPHLQADGGLGAADPASRAREAAEIDREHERAQHVEVEARGRRGGRAAGRWFSFSQGYIDNYQLFFSGGKPMLSGDSPRSSR